MPPYILKPLNPKKFDFWKAWHLLGRAGFGGSREQIETLQSMGLRDTVDHILNFESHPYESTAWNRFDHDIMSPRTPEQQRSIQKARSSGDEAAIEAFRMERQKRQRADREQMIELRNWWMQRMIESPRPLEEKMTLFFHGHFAASYRGIEDSYHMFMQNELFREFATGNFKKLTHRIIRDPAMIKYLNNNQNRKQAPNENLARELMELFTLGEGNDYTEADIKEGARALTGFTYDDDTFAYRRGMHDPGSKTILAQTGKWTGDDFVNIIFSRKSASEFLCFKLYRFFVNDAAEPSRAGKTFIVELAKQFREADYELRPILRTLFSSAHFYDEKNVSAIIKSPIQLIVQAIRSLNTPVRDVRDLVVAGALMGQSIFQPPSVKGWNGGRAWINTSSLFIRQNLMIYLLTGLRPDAYPWQTDHLETFDAMPLVEHLRDEQGRLDALSVFDWLLRFNLGGTPHPNRLSVLDDYLRSRGDRIDNTRLIGLLSLITSMPEYQLC